MVKVAEPLTDESFETKGGNYFDPGIYEVYIQGFKRGKTPNTGSEFVEFDVLGSEDQEGKVRLYLTEKSAHFSLRTLGTIAVHNKEGEAEKQKVRDAFKKILDTDQLTDAMLKRFIGMQAWILVEEDKNAPKPNGGYYLRYNLYGYEPKPRKQTAEELINEFKAGGEPVDTDEIPFD